MIRKLSVFFVALAFMSVAFAQNKQYPNLKISGDEIGTSTISSGLNMSGQKVHFPPVQNMLFTWTVNQMTTLASGYDLQSNGSTQELWYDLTNGYLHGAFTTSQEANLVWSDRTVTYFFSDDNGVNWSELGNVPPPAPTGAKSGFPSIVGLSNGAAVISSHHNLGGGTTRTQIHIDSGPAEFNFTVYDPGLLPNNQGAAIWPKLAVTSDDNVINASSISGGDSAYTNVLNTTSGTFSGWNIYNGDQAETYALAVSPGGTVGHAYIGGTGKEGWAFYRSSSDGGVTWSDPVTVFDPGPGDTVMGTIRGVDLTFAGESPCVVYEVVEQIISTGNYFPGLPSEIHFWNPDLNGGNYVVIADSNNVPYYPYNGINDVQTPVCRPVIGKAQGNEQVLFVAFDATTEFYDTTPDTTSFCAGYFMMSQNSGQTWTTPEQFTPVGSPILDFRYPSIVPVAPVTGDVATVHIAMQGDPLAGSQVNSTFQTGVTAQFYHFTTEVTLTPVSNAVTNTLEFTADITTLLGLGGEPFDPTQDSLLVEGLIWDDLGMNVVGNRRMVSTGTPGIYTTTLTVTSGPNAPNGVGDSTKWKFKAYPDARFVNNGWETTPDRWFVYVADGSTVTLPVIVPNITPILDVTEIGDQIPTVYDLGQNYPNPFNPSTTIRFSLPEAGLVTLKVFNLLGQEVATLVNSEEAAGVYETTFDASLVSNGVYFYTLKTKNFTSTKKMVLLK